MDITWLGHSCFRLRGKECIVITDPYNSDQLGMKLSKQAADLVTISHAHADHNYVEAVKPRSEKPVFTVRGPGEYEVNGVHVTGWKTYHDASKGEERGKNTIYKFEIDGIRIVHLGDLGHELQSELVDDIGEIDVLLIPVGGYYTVNYQQAAKIVSQLEPGMVIPMHYFVEGMYKEIFGQLDTVDKFLQEMGESDAVPEAKLTLSLGDFPTEDIKIVSLEMKS